MAFTLAERERILAAVNSKVTRPDGPGCPMCLGRQWALQDGYVSVPVADRPGNLGAGQPYMPCIALMCQTCGNTLFVNLRLLGLVDIAEGTA